MISSLMTIFRELKMKCVGEKTLLVIILLCSLAAQACADKDKSIKDISVKKDISMQLCQSHDIKSGYISTHVDCGVIQAAGFVDNETQLIEIIQILDSHADKYNILNAVQVVASDHCNVKDQYLTQSIKHRLKCSPYSVRNVSVQVRDGHVVLSGFVSAQVNIAQLTQKIINLRDVIDVENLVLHKQEYFA